MSDTRCFGVVVRQNQYVMAQPVPQTGARRKRGEKGGVNGLKFFPVL